MFTKHKKVVGMWIDLKMSKEDMKLYVVTDRTWLKDKTLVEEVEKILECGATFLQLREKKLSYEESKILLNEYLDILQHGYMEEENA